MEHIPEVSAFREMDVLLSVQAEDYAVPKNDPSFGNPEKFKSTLDFPKIQNQEFGYQVTNQMTARFFNRTSDSAQYAALSKSSVKEIMSTKNT